jgi:hypothetical protein
MDMPAKKYIVELDAGERELLTGFISTGRAHTYPLSSGAIRWYASSTKELSHA